MGQGHQDKKSDHDEHGHEGHSHGHEGHGHDHAGHSHGLGSHRVSSGPSREGEARRLTLTLFISMAAVIAEGVGGYLSHSLALLSDAAHLLADVGAIALSLFALRVASRPADQRRTFGWYRLEILAALVNGAALLAIAVFIVIEAVQRLRDPQPVNVGIVIPLAIVGIVLNGAGLWLTHGGEGASMNLRSTFLHLAGDLLNSVGVLIAAAIIHYTGWLRADPVISFLIAGTIVWSAVRLCREAVDVLLEAFPAHLDFSSVAETLAKVPGVKAVHDLHVWTITSGLVSLSCHMVVTCEGPGCRSHDEILTDARGVLKDRYAIEHSTIQFESTTYQHDELVH